MVQVAGSSRNASSHIGSLRLLSTRGSPAEGTAWENIMFDILIAPARHYLFPENTEALQCGFYWADTLLKRVQSY